MTNEVVKIKAKDFGLENKEVKGIMRAIMFRGLRKKYNQDWHKSKWKYGNLLNSENIGKVGANLDSYEYAEVIPETVCQLTGCRDNDGKGKLIYHKDLIVNQSRNNRDPHVVEWSDKFGGWVGSYRGLEYLIAEELNEIELVGNIFDNPKLL